MPAAQSGVATDDWDAALRSRDGHFLQSTAWQRVQSALGQQVLHSDGAGWSWAGAVRTGRFPRYLYVPYGPTAPSGLRQALADVEEVARRERLDFVRVEPVGDGAPAVLRDAGAVLSRQIQPRFTWILDITRDEQELRHGLSELHRRRINGAARHGLSIRSSVDPADIAIFLDLQRANRGAGRYAGQSDRYHRIEADVLMPLGAARLYIAEAEGAAVAAALSFDWNHVRYYAHAASHPVLGRKLHAGAPLMWQMILDARAGGAVRFDFWGVQPNAPPEHPWAGFTRFKMAFGGELVERAGTWDIPVRPLRYRLYRTAQRLR